MTEMTIFTLLYNYAEVTDRSIREYGEVTPCWSANMDGSRPKVLGVFSTLEDARATAEANGYEASYSHYTNHGSLCGTLEEYYIEEFTIEIDEDDMFDPSCPYEFYESGVGYYTVGRDWHFTWLNKNHPVLVFEGDPEPFDEGEGDDDE